VAHQLAAQQDAQDDGGDGQALDPAVGLDQLRGRQQLGEDAVLGRRVGRRAQAHDRIRQQRVRAEQHHQAAHHLDRVADEHDLALGHGVGEGAHERRQHHVEQREHRHQCRAPARSGPGRLQQFDGGDEQRVVGQRREELRRHDGVETALHPVRGRGIRRADARQISAVSKRHGVISRWVMTKSRPEPPMPRPIQATIHPKPCATTWRACAAAPDAKVWAVVKANAYGHGIERAFDGLRGADGFALLDLAEAERVRRWAGAAPSCCWKGCSSRATWSCARAWGCGTRCIATSRSTCWRRTRRRCRTGCS
jgi:hypothetical protein